MNIVVVIAIPFSFFMRLGWVTATTPYSIQYSQVDFAQIRIFFFFAQRTLLLLLLLVSFCIQWSIEFANNKYIYNTYIQWYTWTNQLFMVQVMYSKRGQKE